MRYYTRGRVNDDTRFFYDNQRDFENCITVALQEDGGVCVAVSDEQAVDSYNEVFECSIHLSQKKAIDLRDWLDRALKRKRVTSPA